MSSLIFITGGMFKADGSYDDNAHQALCIAIKNYYAARIIGINIIFARYIDDLDTLISTKLPINSLVVAGHSFGGDTAVKLAEKLQSQGRKVDHLILLDPVSPNWQTNAPNTRDFILPDNVVEAICYYRVATSIPWSAPIRYSTGRFINYQRDMGHSDSVWNAETLSMVHMALYNNNMVPIANIPVASPVVTAPNVVITPITNIVPIPITPDIIGVKMATYYKDGRINWTTIYG